MAMKKTTMAKKTEVKKSAPVAAAQSAVATKQEVKAPVAATEKKEPVKAKEEEKVTTTTDKKPVAAKTTKPAKATKKSATGSTVKRTPKAKKEVEKVQEVFFEYEGDQILTEDIVERIKNTYKEEGHRISSIKSLRVYINPEERKAYYVINDKADGKFVGF